MNSVCTIVAIVHITILIWMVEVLLKNAKCELVDVDKLGLMEAKYGVFFENRCGFIGMRLHFILHVNRLSRVCD